MEYLSEILAFLGGLATGWTLKIKFNKSGNTTINGNKVGRDIAGRDINHNHKK